MAASNFIRNVAIVGAGGNSGRYMTEELLKTGKHTVTALTRAGSQSKLPEGVISKQIDYNDRSTLVEALTGQDALVITMSTTVQDDSEQKLIEAAGDAGVKWIVPNSWCPDTAHPGLCQDVGLFQKVADQRKFIEQLGKSSHVSIACGFWYEWSLAIPLSYGFDFASRRVTLFDDGNTKTSTTTWPQVGRAVAALLSLPIKSEGSDSSRSLEHFRNKICYINSFTVSQNDMLDSVLRVTGTQRSDWTITNESSKERYAAGVEEMKGGDRRGFIKIMYTRVFYQDGSGDYESRLGVSNERLGLPKEDLDTATAAAIQRAKDSPFPA